MADEQFYEKTHC